MQKWPLWQACRISLLTMRGGRGCRYFFDWLYAVTFRNSLPTHLLHEWQNKKVPWYFSKFSWTWKTPPSSFYRKILTFIANGIRKSPMVLFKIFPEDLPSPPFFEKFLTISFPSLKTFRQLNVSIQTYYMFHRNEFLTNHGEYEVWTPRGLCDRKGGRGQSKRTWIWDMIIICTERY